MAAAASNKTTTNKNITYPDIEEQALQYILDSCELSISKYTKFLQVRIFVVISNLVAYALYRITVIIIAKF